MLSNHSLGSVLFETICTNVAFSICGARITVSKRTEPRLRFDNIDHRFIDIKDKDTKLQKTVVNLPACYQRLQNKFILNMYGEIAI